MSIPRLRHRGEALIPGRAQYVKFPVIPSTKGLARAKAKGKQTLTSWYKTVASRSSCYELFSCPQPHHLSYDLRSLLSQWLDVSSSPLLS